MPGRLSRSLARARRGGGCGAGTSGKNPARPAKNLIGVESSPSRLSDSMTRYWAFSPSAISTNAAIGTSTCSRSANMPRTVPSGPSGWSLANFSICFTPAPTPSKPAFQLGQNAVALDGGREAFLPPHQFVLMRFLPAADFGQLISRRGASIRAGRKLIDQPLMTAVQFVHVRRRRGFVRIPIPLAARGRFRGSFEPRPIAIRAPRFRWPSVAAARVSSSSAVRRCSFSLRI